MDLSFIVPSRKYTLSHFSLINFQVLLAIFLEAVVGISLHQQLCGRANVSNVHTLVLTGNLSCTSSTLFPWGDQSGDQTYCLSPCCHCCCCCLLTRLSTNVHHHMHSQEAANGRWFVAALYGPYSRPPPSSSARARCCRVEI